MATLLGTSYAAGLLLLAIPVLIYVGLRAVALNDLILRVLMIVAAILTFGYVMSAVGGWGVGLVALEAMTVKAQFGEKLVQLPGALWLRMDGMRPPPP